MLFKMLLIFFGRKPILLQMFEKIGEFVISDIRIDQSKAGREEITVRFLRAPEDVKVSGRQSVPSYGLDNLT